MKNIVSRYFNNINNKVSEDYIYTTVTECMNYFNHGLNVHEIDNTSDSLWAFDIITSI